jgi:hypothetical protein
MALGQTQPLTEMSTSNLPGGKGQLAASTVILRVVGGEEKGSLKSETVKYGRESQRTWTQERKIRPRVREGATQKQDHNC